MSSNLVLTFSDVCCFLTEVTNHVGAGCNIGQAQNKDPTALPEAREGPRTDLPNSLDLKIYVSKWESSFECVQVIPMQSLRLFS